MIFFSKYISGNLNIPLIEIKKNTNDSEKITLEYCCLDAHHQIVTILELLKSFGFTVSEIHHPIFSFEKESNNIESPNVYSTNISHTFIEFDSNLNPINLNKLKQSTIKSLNTTILSSLDQNNIINELKTISDSSLNEKKHSEYVHLNNWLLNFNFSFFGYMSIKNNKTLKKYGICKDAQFYKKLTKFVESKATDTFSFETIALCSPIQRFDKLMVLAIPEESNNHCHFFIGILKRSSLLSKSTETPLIRKKTDSIIKALNLIPGSYDFNTFIEICTSLPKSFLFAVETTILQKIVTNLLDIFDPNNLHCFDLTQNDTTKSIQITFPKSDFQNIKENLDSKIEADTGAVITSKITTNCENYIHLYLELELNPSSKVIIKELENSLRSFIEPWKSKLKNLIKSNYGSSYQVLIKKYLNSFPSHYQIRKSPEQALEDIKKIEALKHKSHTFKLDTFIYEQSAFSNKVNSFNIYHKEKLSLNELMPLLQNLGLYIIDELSTRIGAKQNVIAYIHTFRLQTSSKQLLPIEIDNKISSLFENILNNIVTNDPTNKIIIKENINWKELKLIHCFKSLYIQYSTIYSNEKINTTLVTHSFFNTLFINYFNLKFDPKLDLSLDKRKKELKKIESQIINKLQEIKNLSDDTILRSIFYIIKSLTRTNFFQNDTLSTITLKINSQELNFIPKPKPKFEIFVYDTTVEGIHLRFDSISRGGLRWSDRPEDFRTEILGLVKTQQTKNVVIVPAGAKGGFVIKKELTNENVALESENAYKTFIKSLLSITDSVDTKRAILKPKNCVFWDENDPYLVVAADKGTAWFSDIANEISNSNKFWLGDAFASGGSNGYNHKEVGITAKGAWECVKLHFLEMGKNIQKESFSVVGVGDMSGDVFGNGMLLSKKIKLVAAFNHMHIFIDPNPNEEVSWNERNRLFKLNNSKWSDYDTSTISNGGGIFDRNSKEIHLNQELKSLLNTKKNTLSGNEVINHILKIKAELLWLGGIGTYIKSNNESNEEVGDPSNNLIRINSSECNFSVLGEGANLGLTQKARLDLDRKNIKLNTDFIDNSAGVNMSDYEVNIKILLELLVTEKKITKTQSDKILEAATDEVTELVLRNNVKQHQAISLDLLRCESAPNNFIDYINHLISKRFLDPSSEHIPDSNVLTKIINENRTLQRPLLAILLAYCKMDINSQIDTRGFFKDKHFYSVFKNYFPNSFIKKYEHEIKRHYLKPNIIATQVINELINNLGSTFFYILEYRFNIPLQYSVTTYIALKNILDLDQVFDSIFNSNLSLKEKYSLQIQIQNKIKLIIKNLYYLKIKISLNQIESLKNLHIFNKVIEEKSDIKKIVKQFENTDFSTLICIIHKNELSNIENVNNVINLVNMKFKFNTIIHNLNQINEDTTWDISLKVTLIKKVILNRQKITNSIIKHENSKDINVLIEKSTLKYKNYFEILKSLSNNDLKTTNALTVLLNNFEKN